MSPRARTTAPKRSGSSTRRSTAAKRGKGHTALDRLTKSVDAAQDALKDLRKEMSRGSSGILKDLEKQLSDTRKNLRSTSKSVLKDLEGLQQRIPGARSGGTKRTSSSARKTASRSGTSRSTAARKSRSSSSAS